MKFIFFVLKIFVIIFGILIISQLEYKGRKLQTYASEMINSKKVQDAFNVAKKSVIDNESTNMEQQETQKNTLNSKVQIVKESNKAKQSKVAKTNKKELDKITEEDRKQLQDLIK